MEVLIFFGSLACIIFATKKIFGYIDKKSKSLSEKLFQNRQIELSKIIDLKHAESAKNLEKLEASLKEKEAFVTKLTNSFDKDYVSGRKWLAEFIAEASKSLDDSISNDLYNKKRPAKIAANEVKEAKVEKREAIAKLKAMEYEIKTYKEYFPILQEYEEIILNERLDFLTQDNTETIDNSDRAALWLTKEEFSSLPISERNQLALDKYTKRNKKNWEIGRLYERFLGYQYEIDGWDVDFIGAIKGFEDMGRDLICKKGNEIHIVQAKCWSKDKTIHEKHIFQLFGTTLCYGLENNKDFFRSITPVFSTTAQLSKVAQLAADKLGVRVNHILLDNNYPSIKCNINQRDRIYHLPFDQQYDKVKIQGNGEIYVHSVKEAENFGFRRAKRFYST